MADRQARHEGARGAQPEGQQHDHYRESTGGAVARRPVRRRPDDPWTVDCESCPVREVRCADCVVTALAGLPVVVQPSELWHGSFEVATEADTKAGSYAGIDEGIGTDTGSLRQGGQLPLDSIERRAVDVFVRAGLLSATDAAGVTATREPWASPARRRVAG